MEHQEYQELLASHSLGVLDPGEARTLEAHLSGCAECRDEFVEFGAAAGLLAYSATPAEPRPEVRASILAAARIQAEDRRSAEIKTPVLPFPMRARTSPWPNLLRLAAAIAFGALLVGVVVLWRRDVNSRREIALLTREVSRQQREMARGRDQLAHNREALALLTSPNAKKAELAGTQTAQNARGMFVFDRQTGRAMLMTEGLPMPPADKAYELWFIADGHPMPGKVFTVDASGRAMISDEVPLEARERAVFAITLEPKDGVKAPTGAIYLSSPST